MLHGLIRVCTLAGGVLVLSGMHSVGMAQAAAPEAAQAEGGWLESRTPPRWNTPGMALPTAPQAGEDDFGLESMCLARAARWAETPQDQAVTDAGWSLYSAYHAGWGVMVVSGTSGYDGMCRPVGYQDFVFVDGTFAGTLSPELMTSRSTGAGTVLNLFSDTLSARFVRYADTDALCCPSRPSVVVTYNIERAPAGPVVNASSRYEEAP
jgi:hypothetical protein